MTASLSTSALHFPSSSILPVLPPTLVHFPPSLHKWFFSLGLPTTFTILQVNNSKYGPLLLSRIVVCKDIGILSFKRGVYVIHFRPRLYQQLKRDDPSVSYYFSQERSIHALQDIEEKQFRGTSQPWLSESLSRHLCPTLFFLPASLQCTKGFEVRIMK